MHSDKSLIIKHVFDRNSTFYGEYHRNRSDRYRHRVELARAVKTPSKPASMHHLYSVAYFIFPHSGETLPFRGAMALNRFSSKTWADERTDEQTDGIIDRRTHPRPARSSIRLSSSLRWPKPSQWQPVICHLSKPNMTVFTLHSFHGMNLVTWVQVTR